MHDIFFFTDIHGSYSLYKAVMEYCIKQDPECSIIYGGDACDRGPDGYKIMRELLYNPQVVYLKGNHEDMFCKATHEIKELFNFTNPARSDVEKTLKACKFFDYKYAVIQDCLYNGGLSTLTDWVMNGMPTTIIERLEELPLTFSYENMDFCHAAGIYRTFKDAADAEYEGKEVNLYTAESLLWSRTAMDMEWEEGRLAVFGHTPTPYFINYAHWTPPEDWKPMPILYNNKLDMDTGAVFTHRAYVLNILTMQAQGFEEKDDKIEEIEMIQF